ncbi:hypothetical protein NDQ53_00880 [Rossellomorea marisflavi]|uniref:hypothetical protein n=1 Tax=Rossellomorea marisflavi TaxID=189381 RepID=UPI002041FD00|nr:hypothetical protein [Rossellomorea marisflavi]MCM2587854.1 hypothetical protein [Rossellomorea marisflavi]
MRSKWLVLTILILCMLPILAGCKLVAFEGVKEKEPKKKETTAKGVMVDFNPNLVLLGPKMVVRGETSLPEGTVVTVQIKPFSDSDDYLRIVNSGAEPLDEIKGEEDVKVEETKEFGPVAFPRAVSEQDKRFRIEAFVDPRKQPEEIQKLLGSNGEHIKDSLGMKTVEDGDAEVVILRKYTDVMTYEENGFQTIDPRPFVAGEKGEEISPTGGPNLKN